ncbi:MAG: transglycosylase domain-containing protein [Acidimicrobiales bacterium]
MGPHPDPRRRRAAPRAGKHGKHGKGRTVRRQERQLGGGKAARRGGLLWRRRRWVFGACLAAFAVLAGGVYTMTRAPLPKARALAQTTFVYDASGHVIATLSQQNRVDVPLSRVPRVVIDAVVSTEDRHFFTEGALNPVSIVRAAISDLAGSGSLQGASTITQQYVKQAYLSPKRTLTRKVKEAAIAIHLSRVESKDQILQGYLNTIYWGRGAYGVEAASQAYFGENVTQLELPEASLLAGLIRQPVTADPARDPALARTNQTATLDAMVRDHKITGAQASAVEATPFSRYVISPNASAGVVSELPGAEYFVSAVRQELYAKYGRQTVGSGGLRVTTSLDPTLQREAYDAVYGHNADSLNPAANEPSGALVSIDDNGYVKALVGGKDFATSAVDLALGAQGGGSGRQPGSTFKAFMLAEVIREGYSVASKFPAPPEVVIPHGNSDGTPWSVTNFEHEKVPPVMALVDATALSVNTVYAQVVDRVGASKLDSMAEALGIRPSELAGAYPSQVLGTADVSPLEMAAAYATFADGGVYHAPLLVTRVTTAEDTPLPLPVAPTSRVVLTPEQAAQESYVLQQVVLHGTGTAAGNVGSPVAGKTGTTEHSGDAWFIGYTPNLTTAVWMGYAQSEKPMLHFRGLSSVQGGTIPAELWHNYMAAALASEPQYKGAFPGVYSLVGRVLSPPAASSLRFPLGMGTTTTTTVPATTVPATTVPKTTTTPATSK